MIMIKTTISQLDRNIYVYGESKGLVCKKNRLNVTI